MSETTQHRNAQQTVEEYWRRQDSGDYNQVVSLFAEDARLEDPVYGTYQGRDEIASFMALMVEETRKQEIYFTVETLEGRGGDQDDEGIAWSQWVGHSPAGRMTGCGIYRVRHGLLTYYRDYIDAPAQTPADANSATTPSP